MARVDVEARTLALTLVVFGAPRAGKSALLRAIHERIAANQRDEDTPVGASGDIGLPLDWVPVDLGEVAGWRTRVHLYAVPPQIHADATRRLVLAQADGVLFVADAQAGRFEANQEAMAALRSHLVDDQGNARNVPMVLVITKEDLPDELLLERVILEAALLRDEMSVFSCNLARGEGVFRALQSVIGAAMRQVIALPEDAP